MDTSRETVEMVLSSKNDTTEWKNTAIALIKSLQFDVAAIERQFDTRAQQVSIGLKFDGEADVEKFEGWKVGARKAAKTKLNQIRSLESAMNSGDEVPRTMLYADVLYEIACEASECNDQSEKLKELFDKLDHIWPRWRMSVNG